MWPRSPQVSSPPRPPEHRLNATKNDNRMLDSTVALRIKVVINNKNRAFRALKKIPYRSRFSRDSDVLTVRNSTGGRNEFRNGVGAIIAATRHRACNAETVHRIPDVFRSTFVAFRRGLRDRTVRFVCHDKKKRSRERNCGTFRRAVHRVRSLIVRRQWPFVLGWDDFVSLVFPKPDRAVDDAPVATCLTAIHTIPDRRQSVTSRRTQRSATIELTNYLHNVHHEGLEDLPSQSLGVNALSKFNIFDSSYLLKSSHFSFSDVTNWLSIKLLYQNTQSVSIGFRKSIPII